MLSHLRSDSARSKKPHSQQPKTVVIAKAPSDIAAAAAMSDDDPDESPKANWMQLMKQKKQVKESTLARMIRVRHAVLVVQVCSRVKALNQMSLQDGILLSSIGCISDHCTLFLEGCKFHWLPQQQTHDQCLHTCNESFGAQVLRNNS